MDRLDFVGVAKALLQNALDEARALRCRVIDLELSGDRIRISDDGQGIPISPHPRSGRALLEVVMMGPRRGPKNTLAQVNAHCLWLEAEIHRDGMLWYQRYDFAQPVAPVQQRGEATRRGTTITCAPACGEALSFDRLRELVHELTQAEPGVKVKVRLRDKREPRDETIVIA